VNRLMKQFDQTRKMMKMVSGMGSSRMAQMAAAMKGKAPKF
jgi:signal recognition particle subunit SRP54